MTEVYYLEDDEAIAMAVKEYLEQRGFQVTVFPTLAKAREAFAHHLPGIALVDWNMPDGEGGAFCKWLRVKWKDLPIIFLTVRGDASDIVSGFENGADDYVTKPFALAVLHSRIGALLRRAGGADGQTLACGQISMDKDKMAVFYQGKEVRVSQAEYQILQILMENQGRTVTRERLLEQIWDSNGSYVNDNTLTVAIKRLREKLHQPSCIKTIRSFGYRMEEDV